MITLNDEEGYAVDETKIAAVWKRRSPIWTLAPRRWWHFLIPIPPRVKTGRFNFGIAIQFAGGVHGHHELMYGERESHRDADFDRLANTSFRGGETHG